jgi:hypothetical protein
MCAGSAASMLASGVAGAATVRAAGERAATRVVWTGTVTATYDGNGSTNNHNCGSSCYSRSIEHASVTVSLGRVHAKVRGNVSLHESTDYNSQCGGMTTRDEVDAGRMRKTVTAGNSGVALTFFQSGKYQVTFNSPGIPYGGTITDETVLHTSAGETCNSATRTSSGVFYLPAIDEPIIRKPTPHRLHGSVTYDPTSCTYPRVICSVKLTWSLTKLKNAVGESPGKPSP